ncbi:MAG: pseudouridine synthase [Lachnospiraceae bacterium]|nr:pseudouridine synthase [Lachnospiraceae bacterium]
MEKERLNKYLASCGLCSRREADRMIEEGRVMVNGERAIAGMRVDGRDKILVNGKPVHGKDEKVVLAYYKPVGVTCTEKDRFADKKITDMVKFPVRVTYAGRLDKDSEGLLLLTNDGELINTMMRGSAGHEKEYMVRVNREITQDFIQKMEAGVYLSELDLMTKPCKVEKTGKFTFKIILTQGINRQIKRMTRELGVHVISIKRIRVVNIRLEKLRPGEYRKLSEAELEMLYHLCMQ